ERVLEWASEGSGEAVWRAEVLSEEEERRVLREWNETGREWSESESDSENESESEWSASGELLHEVVAQQAARTPERVAVESGAEVASYEELERRGNQLGRYLRERGVRAEERVGILVERGVEMVAGLLGIMKAGGAYVPLDPHYPQQRLAFMLEDAGCSVLLTQKHLLETLPAHTAQVVCLDDEHEAIAAQSCEPLPALQQPDNLAYVIYTSGSTGVPKGVAITHRSAAVLLQWAHETFTDEHLAGVLASTSICFDLSVFELFAPLSRGGKIILAENALQLPQLGDAGPITLVNTVPSAMTELVRAGGIPDSVRVVNLAGEALPQSLVEQIYKHEQVAEVWNLYGPSEDTTYSTAALMDKGLAGTPSIGRPITNTEVYILDEYLQPAPLGAAGQLYLSGDGLARGYLNRPELTAEKFVPHPFSLRGGERMYATGDRARYLRDGEIEYLGRIDYQVKIRGFRIELGEIEAALLEQAAVREAVVVAADEPSGGKRLVAYLVWEQEAEALSVEELRATLRERLPEHMIPAAFVFLVEMPLSPNGKINRRALPEPESSGRALHEYVGPRDGVEEQLVSIWEELLAARPIGVRDSFFELGGHSLLTVRLMSRIKQQMGKSLPLAAIFEGGTIEQLARLINRDEALADWSPLVKLRDGGSARPFFLVHPVGGNVLSYASLVNHLGRERGYYGLQARGLMEGQTPLSRIDEMVAEYLAALRAVQPEGPYLLGGWSMGGVVAFEMARQLTAQREQVELLALIDSKLPLGERVVEDTASLLFEFALDLGLVPEAIEISREAFLSLNPDEQLSHAFMLAKELKALPLELSFEQFQRLFDVFRHNRRAMLEYAPEKYTGRITLLKASDALALNSAASQPDDALLSTAQDNGRAATVELYRDWNELAAEGVELQLVPGTHYTIMREPNVARLAGRLQAYIDNGR
ncbi:MAG: hypothetical protein QOF02_2079, partial [Blastocatellia bacterium]|nr:hypothetical protein [Blastocatellia bacterium]